MTYCNMRKNMLCLVLAVSEPSPCGHRHFSEQEEEEEDDDDEGAGLSQQVPQTPDQEAFLKQHFVTLAELCSAGKRFTSATAWPQTAVPQDHCPCDHLNCVYTGSPSRTSHSSSESLSISSRFLSCQSSAAR